MFLLVGGHLDGVPEDPLVPKKSNSLCKDTYQVSGRLGPGINGSQSIVILVSQMNR